MEELIIKFSQEIVNINKIGAYIFFFISQGLQVLFPPYPGDTILILEGYLAQIANLNILFVIINAISATFFSSLILYRLGYTKGYSILESKLLNKLFDTKKVNILKNKFNKYGYFVIILSKFFPGFYSITILTAGIFKVKKEKVYISILINTSFHHILLILLGKSLGENWIVVIRFIESYSRYFTGIIVILLLIYISIYFGKKNFFKNE